MKESKHKGDSVLKRVAAAFLLIPAVVLAVFYASQLYFTVLISAVIFLALLEYNNLSPAQKPDRGSDVLVMAVGLLMPYVFYFYGGVYALPLVVLGSFVFFLNGLLRKSGAGGHPPVDGIVDLREAHLHALSGTMGVVYVAVPLSYSIVLREMPSGGKWIMLMLAVIWLNDTCAFAAGKTLGRTKLSPWISPKKTIEGAIAGLAGGVIAGYALNAVFGLGAGTVQILCLSFLIGVVGIIGDLAESLLKRSAGVKDSGAIIPGHGGLLDRIDSLIFAIPLLYYFLLWRF